MQTFKPTALLVMSHNKTGLKYFCKTAVLDRVKWYKGSGKRWLNHLNFHGKDITVGVLGIYNDEKKCNESALKFSKENNIVESNDWANLIEETGLMTGVSTEGEKNHFYGKTHTDKVKALMSQQRLGKSVNKGAYRSHENRAKISASLKGRKNPGVSKAMSGKVLSEETRKKISIAAKGRTVTMETKEKLRLAALKQWAKQKQQPADEVTL